MNLLPSDMVKQIPRSTLHDWKSKNDGVQLFGYSWYLQNKNIFDTLELICKYNRLLQINKAILRIFALRRFYQQYKTAIHQNKLNTTTVFLHHFEKAKKHLGYSLSLKYLNISHSTLCKIRRKHCQLSWFKLCLVKHPWQLLSKEVAQIKDYCAKECYQYWSLASVYYQMRRETKTTTTILFDFRLYFWFIVQTAMLNFEWFICWILNLNA